MLSIIEEYLAAFFSLTTEMAPYLLLGFLFAGLLHVYFPKEKLNKYLGRNNFASVFNASLLGVPLPLCSCGVIPTGVSFYKNGASKGASVSFLISTPQTGIDSILATSALMGWPFAIMRTFIAMVTGVLGGVATNVFTPSKPGEAALASSGGCAVPLNGTPKSTTTSKVKSMFRYAFVDFMQDISRWLIMGLAIAALMTVVIPDNFFEEYISNNFLGMLLLLAASVPLYVCATGSIPIAAVLLMKGLSPGAAFVFLMAGPATNAGTITVLAKTLGKKTLAVYLGAIMFGALAFGLIIDNFLPASWFILPISAEHAGHFHLIPHWLEVGSGILLLGLIAFGELKRYSFNWFKGKEKQVHSSNQLKTDTNMAEKTIKVTGMTCNHCKFSVEKNVGAIAGISTIDVDLNGGRVVLHGDHIDLDSVEKTIKEIGFEYEGEVV